ncbi:Endoglucanase [Rhynchospora pubera]|uniref:cellulase n=1 Tax=Rhynchospora pubera TaxID=906938 RepID=A0AAV8FR67_9POAL|nr:Endoglucanase [Rhynchospora pubera]KAJ4792752.1 Endoglucanase [Rhynchospora pubera]KAJ4816572.1 Endoglucanase [Rhynchospora pubera]
MRYLNFILLAILALSNGYFMVDGGKINYKDALTKSIMFLEAQRSGKLPRNNRIKWRGDSGLDDGKLAGVDLVGGYYDAGDNVKYGLPMAFTVTTLAWTAITYKSELKTTRELGNVHAAIRWGTDYFIKAATKKNFLWVQVGDPVKDHQCWTRPENMQTPRTLYKINQQVPGTEIAAETAAAMAASAIVFRDVDQKYSRRLLNKAKLLFDFAKSHKGTYDGECPFYCSYSGYNDELLWGATWLYLATKKAEYYKFITEQAVSSSVAEFSWDLKYAGAQVLLAEMHLSGEHSVQNFKQQADNFICAVLPDTSFHHVYITKGGLIHLRDGANTQYVTSTAFLFFAYSNILTKNRENVHCGKHQIKPARLREFAKQQMDYLLGSNPNKRSYMAGFGVNPPTQPHHRGASVPILQSKTVVECGMSFSKWFQRDAPNYNELTGAIVGGPDKNDKFIDKRSESSMLEPCTYINSLAIGPLAELAVHGK